VVQQPWFTGFNWGWPMANCHFQMCMVALISVEMGFLERLDGAAHKRLLQMR
jgi:hypothetical protein